MTLNTPVSSALNLLSNLGTFDELASRDFQRPVASSFIKDLPHEAVTLIDADSGEFPLQRTLFRDQLRIAQEGGMCSRTIITILIEHMFATKALKPCKKSRYIDMSSLQEWSNGSDI